MMVRSLNVTHKLGVAALLFLVPVGYLLAGMIGAGNTTINFSQKERVGTVYLRDLAHLHQELANAALAGKPPPDNAAARLAEAERLYGEGLESAELSAAAVSAVRSPVVETVDGNTGSRPALRALIARIGDKSNLILDPDLDSFYVMDLTLLKLPEALDRVVTMVTLARQTFADGMLDSEEKVGFYVELGGLKAVTEGIDASLAAAYGGNADGSVKAALDQPARILLADLRDLLAGIEHGVPQKAAVDHLLAGIVGFNAATSAELERLLVRRIDGFRMEQYRMLLITAVLFTASAMAVLLVVTRGVLRPLHGIETAMNRLAEGDLENEIPGLDRRDEVGRMARAVAVFRKNATERRRMEADREREAVAKERRRIAMEQLTCDFNRSVSGMLGTLADASTELHATAQSMTEAAGNTSSRSMAVAAAAEQASVNVETAAAAAEELSAASADISRHVEHSSQTARAAEAQAGRAVEVV
ncbi:HAMP domain-containing protein, partial [Skermanella stibiiresistens]|uniref:HAMP domain-containing protein n=1 Tax=Skermanella stibiiresistens TaxID=913326 RepID=UPI0012F7882A